MNNLGKLETTIKPNLGNYLLFCLVGLVAIAIAVLFPEYYANWVWLGIPSILVVYVAVPILIIFAVIYYLQGKKADENIELYENGLKIGEFTSNYENLELIKKRGLIFNFHVFKNENESKKYKFPINKKQINLITEKLK